MYDEVSVLMLVMDWCLYVFTNHLIYMVAFVKNQPFNLYGCISIIMN